MTYESGQVLQERYQLQRRLGHTIASRQTWLATDLTSATAELVILKLLAFGPQVEWQELELFEREAKILRALQHPGIPRYRDYFAIDRDASNVLPWFVLVQDYIAGHSLKDLLTQGKHFSQRQVQQIATKLLHLLCYLHELSPPVLHRDIKPSNVIWGEEDAIYLVDFGAVQDRAATEGATFTVVGTYGYTPMEQFGGRAVAASDLYALGATLIHLLTGTAPAELPQKNLQIQFADRVSLNPAVAQWMATLTEPDVTKRFQSARQALTALRAIGDNRNPQTTSSARSARSLPPAAPRQLEPTQQRTQAIALPPPYKTRIEVQQTADQLLIKIPGANVGQLFLLVPIAIILLLVFGQIFFALILTVTNIPLVLLFGLLITALIAGSTYWEILPTYVELQRSRFCIYKLPFGSPVVTVNGVTGNIQDVFHTLKTFRNGKSSDEKRVVIIQTYGGEDHFGKGLNWEECSWLVNVIQDWLHLH
jgi:serine/threonine protein kinase